MQVCLCLRHGQGPNRGLDVPNFKHYYLANWLQYLIKWLHPNDDYNSLIELEQLDCNNIKLSDLPFITVKRHNCYKNPLVATTLTAWWKTMEITDIQLEPCMFSPIWQYLNFENNKEPLVNI